MIKYILLLLYVISTTACYNPRLDMFAMPKLPKEGPPDYLDGWQAGCETGMTAYSNSHLRSRYHVNVDGARMRNAHYSKGWELGQRYCSYYVSTYLSNKEMSYPLGDMAQADYRSDNTWFSLKSDGFFSYKGFDIFNQGGFDLTRW